MKSNYLRLPNITDLYKSGSGSYVHLKNMKVYCNLTK